MSHRHRKLGAISARDGDERASDRVAGSRSRAALIRRLRRIEGQTRGLQKMVEEQREAAELLMQIASVRYALHSVATIVLETYLAQSAQIIAATGDAADGARLAVEAAAVFQKWSP
ncbi:MAG TPA: metal-sensing transcriptional repressor [Gemmatimonadales bacterium]|jgi:DNA-binding FrmR family transcriptional regulator